ncbi:uncharacterized protein [Eurosta solidaginis]|uniref:uncharacterized protein n=1 Tax=Eurosta solidaginis TaxID=178769 RepID=UPI0035305CA7
MDCPKLYRPSVGALKSFDTETVAQSDVTIILKRMEDKIDSISADVKKLKEIACQHTVALDSVLKTMNVKPRDLKLFPINSLSQLQEFEENCENYTHVEIVSYIKQKFGGIELYKMLQAIFADTLLAKINWDGKKGKEAIQNFKLFNYFIYEALKENHSSYPEFEKKMKKAFHKAKAASYRRKNNEKLKV